MQRNPNAFVTGRSAARLWGIPVSRRLEDFPGLEVAVRLGDGVAPSGRGIAGRLLDIPENEIVMRGSVRVLSVEQTWCYLGSQLSIAELVAAGDFLVHHRDPLTTQRRLQLAMFRFVGRRGVRRLRVALPLLNDRAESPRESQLRVILQQAGIVGLVANHTIRTSDGHVYRADLAIPNRMMVIEYQSDLYHSDPRAFRRDMTRISNLNADDYEVIQVNADDLWNSSDLVARVRRSLDRRPHIP